MISCVSLFNCFCSNKDHYFRNWPASKASKKNKGKKRKIWWESRRNRGSRDHTSTPSDAVASGEAQDWSPVYEEAPEAADRGSEQTHPVAALKPKSAPVTPPWRQKAEPVAAELAPRRAETADLMAAVERQFKIADGEAGTQQVSCWIYVQEGLPSLFIFSKDSTHEIYIVNVAFCPTSSFV